MQANNENQDIDDGYLVVAGQSSDNQAPVYIGWAPRDGRSVSRLMKQLRKQSPTIQMLEFCPCRIEEVLAVKRGHCQSWAGYGEWFLRTPEIDGLLTAIRGLDAEEKRIEHRVS